MLTLGIYSSRIRQMNEVQLITAAFNLTAAFGRTFIERCVPAVAKKSIGCSSGSRRDYAWRGMLHAWC